MIWVLELVLEVTERNWNWSWGYGERERERGFGGFWGYGEKEELVMGEEEEKTSRWRKIKKKYLIGTRKKLVDEKIKNLKIRKK